MPFHLDSTNVASLDAIETAILMLCLDTAEPSLSSVHTGAPYLDHSSTVVAQRLLHGSGPGANSANRWFDTTMMVRLDGRGHIAPPTSHLHCTHKHSLLLKLACWATGCIRWWHLIL